MKVKEKEILQIVVQYDTCYVIILGYPGIKQVEMYCIMFVFAKW